jgi:hypothetical protein
MTGSAGEIRRCEIVGISGGHLSFTAVNQRPCAHPTLRVSTLALILTELFKQALEFLMTAKSCTFAA